VVIVLAVLLGLVLLFRGLSPEDELIISGGDDQPSITTSTLDRNAPPPTDLTTTTLPPPRQAGEVTVLVANGTRTDGEGAKVADVLRQAGYQAPEATDTAAPADASSVFFIDGYQADAVQIANVLGLPATAIAPLGPTPPVGDLGAAQVLVVTGPDLPRRISE
jgi:hypothetical protein